VEAALKNNLREAPARQNNEDVPPKMALQEEMHVFVRKATLRKE
jgi:hypothetical protein